MNLTVETRSSLVWKRFDLTKQICRTVQATATAFLVKHQQYITLQYVTLCGHKVVSKYMQKLCVLTCFANMLQWAESFVGTQRYLPVVVAQLVASQCASAVRTCDPLCVCCACGQCACIPVTSAVHVILCDCCASQFPVEDSVCLCPSVPVSVVHPS